jgi:hypothetical protein
MLKSVEKWSCESRNNKTVVNYAIFNTSAIWSYRKIYFYDIFNIVFSSKIQNFSRFGSKLILLWKMYVCRPSWIFTPFFCPFYGLSLKINVKLTNNHKAKEQIKTNHLYVVSCVHRKCTWFLFQYIHIKFLNSTKINIH